MNGKKRGTDKALTLDVGGTRRYSADNAAAGSGRRHATPETPTPGARPSSTPGSLWQKLQLPRKKSKPPKTPSSDDGPAAGERDADPVEDAPSAKSTDCLSPEMLRELAKEAASMVMTKTFAQTPKTAGSFTATRETNRTRLLETGTTDAAEAVVDARQSAGDICTGEAARSEEATAANDTDHDRYDDDDDDSGGGGEQGYVVRPRPRPSVLSTTTTDGGDSGWSSLSPTRRRHVSDGQQHQQHQQQHHHHYHYHHDHHHRRWHSSGSLSLLGRSTTPGTPPRDARGDEPSTPAPNEYHHHHHHHHYHHHYYHFRGRPVKEQTPRPISLPSDSAQTVLPQEDIEKNKKYENNDTETMTIEFQETPSKTPRTLFHNMISHFGSNGKAKLKKKFDKSLSVRSLKNNMESNCTLNQNLELKIDEDTPKYVENTLKNTILELVRTEKEYVANLNLVVKGYMAVMEDPETENCNIPVPEDLKINSKKFESIFINIKPIYEWHRDVCLPALERSRDKPQELNGLLQKRDDILKMYIVYCEKIHNFEYLVHEYENYFEKMRNFFGHDLQLSSIMAKPLQRIIIFNDLLKDIFKTVKHEKLKMDTKIIQETIKDLNKFIQDFDEIRIANQLKERDTIINTTPSNLNSQQNIDEKACKEARKKLEFVMHELINTEEQYVNDLGLVVNGYMAVMANPKAADCDIPIPLDFQSNSSIHNLVFVNIKQIYNWHRDVCLPAVKKCLTQPQELQKLFKKLHSNIKMYSTYCQKNSISKSLVVRHEDYFEDMRQFLGHELQISAILIKPVQRISKYNLLLKEILKYMVQSRMHDQTKYIQNSINTMTDLMQELNEIVIIDRVYNFDGDISSQGRLLLHGVLRCAEKYSEVKVEFKDLYVFLFEKIMIFTVEVTNKYKPLEPLYYYKGHILLNKMELDDNQYNQVDGSFVIRSTDSISSPMRQYICRPVTEASRFKWFEILQRLQEAKQTFERNLMNPLG